LIKTSGGETFIKVFIKVFFGMALHVSYAVPKKQKYPTILNNTPKKLFSRLVLLGFHCYKSQTREVKDTHFCPRK